MSDRRLRKLERAMKAGDQDAGEQLYPELYRRGLLSDRVAAGDEGALRWILRESFRRDGLVSFGVTNRSTSAPYADAQFNVEVSHGPNPYEIDPVRVRFFDPRYAGVIAGYYRKTLLGTSQGYGLGSNVGISLHARNIMQSLDGPTAELMRERVAYITDWVPKHERWEDQGPGRNPDDSTRRSERQFKASGDPHDMLRWLSERARQGEDVPRAELAEAAYKTSRGPDGNLIPDSWEWHRAYETLGIALAEVARGPVPVFMEEDGQVPQADDPSNWEYLETGRAKAPVGSHSMENMYGESRPTLFWEQYSAPSPVGYVEWHIFRRRGGFDYDDRVWLSQPGGDERIAVVGPTWTPSVIPDWREGRTTVWILRRIGHRFVQVYSTLQSHPTIGGEGTQTWRNRKRLGFNPPRWKEALSNAEWALKCLSPWSDELQSAVERSIEVGAVPPLEYQGAGASGIVVCDQRGHAFKAARHPSDGTRESMSREYAWFQAAKAHPETAALIPELYAWHPEQVVIERECVRADPAVQGTLRPWRNWWNWHRQLEAVPNWTTPEGGEDQWIAAGRGPVIVDGGYALRRGPVLADHVEAVLDGRTPWYDEKLSSLAWEIYTDTNAGLIPPARAKQILARLRAEGDDSEYSEPTVSFGLANPPGGSDRQIRDLERRVAQGDPSARVPLYRRLMALGQIEERAEEDEHALRWWLRELWVAHGPQPGVAYHHWAGHEMHEPSGVQFVVQNESDYEHAPGWAYQVVLDPVFGLQSPRDTISVRFYQVDWRESRSGSVHERGRSWAQGPDTRLGRPLRSLWLRDFLNLSLRSDDSQFPLPSTPMSPAAVRLAQDRARVITGRGPVSHRLPGGA